MLRKFKAKKQVLFSDYITNSMAVTKVAEKSDTEDFLFFPRTKTNEHYHAIPKILHDENSNDIVKLADAKNYLYLINASAYGSKKQYLDAIAATNYDLVAIDLYYNDAKLTAKYIAPLKTKANGGKRLVLSYLNIGAAENWRYYWRKGWKLGNPSWIKKKYEGYDDEFYVEYWNPEWQKIITGNKNSYIRKIVDAGFDGAFLDNIEAYYALYNK
jgi:cysteinyl-tRNA synthetase